MAQTDQVSEVIGGLKKKVALRKVEISLQLYHTTLGELNFYGLIDYQKHEISI